LDLLQTAKTKNQIETEAVKAYLEFAPKTTEPEIILINNLLDDEKPRYNEENGFGLYNPEYRPEFAPIVRQKFGLADFRAITSQDMIDLLNSLIALAEKHKEYTYKTRYYSNSEVVDVILGERDKLDTSINPPENGDYLDYFILADVWRGWFEQNKDKLGVMVKIQRMINNFYNNYVYRGYNEFGINLINRLFGNESLESVVNENSNSFCRLALDIINKMITHAARADQNTQTQLFEISYGILCDVYLDVSQEDWLKILDPPTDSGYLHKITLARTRQIKEFTGSIRTPDFQKEDENFKKTLGLFYAISVKDNQDFYKIELNDVARAAQMGLIERGELARAIMNQLGGIYRTFGNHYNNLNEGLIALYPIYGEVLEECKARVIEIELNRGDSKTPVSHLAKAIRRHKGAETFAALIAALGKETFTRGYSWGGENSKRDVLSSLLKSSVPAEHDNAETLGNALGSRIEEKRLLEAVMYAPAWIGIAQDYLGWDGFKSAAWYFHAHTRESFSNEFETEVARFSPIDKEDFSRGAFDIKWFKEAYATIGQERFDILYDCAKYISGGSGHRRAQLFADAVLGKLDAKELEIKISDKRNKDLLLAYSLMPIAHDSENLTRYEFIHAFLKQSRKFGAQRQASEKITANIALQNLARNLGYSDVLRFSWKMEIAKLDDIQKFFIPTEIDGASVFLEWGDKGKVEVIIEKKGKLLKSIPKGIKKHEHIIEMMQLRTDLRSQFSRSRISLEKAMENQDVFTFGEVAELMQHPVIGIMLEKLVFRCGDTFGFLTSEGLESPDKKIFPAKQNDILTIAHPCDLSKADIWDIYQSHAFDSELVQPFKQIFRELYIVNEDEQEAKTVS
ncbi:MAG: DUF4132 domain-containing protein, partial [Defluviitaleaceae bacterium]|nr:DUF4132 domain-containing protein [Defluviitaleaceae bacterium]